jgi:copper chaperone CopZ
MEYVHHVPGRLRVRSSSLKRDTRRVVEIKRHLLTIPGIASVDANPVTGSLTICFDEGATTPASLLAALSAQGFSMPSQQDRTPQMTINPVARRVFENAGKAASVYLLEKAVEKSVMLLVTALL